MTGGVGWFAPFYHRMFDGFSGMHGTSQATPHVAGIISCLVEGDIVDNQLDFKRLMSYNTKTPDAGYGLVTFSAIEEGMRIEKPLTKEEIQPELFPS
jgi:subtilisin family serine protease